MQSGEESFWSIEIDAKGEEREKDLVAPNIQQKMCQINQ